MKSPESFKKIRRAYYSQLAIIFPNQLTDILTTYVALTTNPLIQEQNILINRFFLENGDYVGLTAVKMATGFFAVGIMEAGRYFVKNKTNFDQEKLYKLMRLLYL